MSEFKIFIQDIKPLQKKSKHYFSPQHSASRIKKDTFEKEKIKSTFSDPVEYSVSTEEVLSFVRDGLQASQFLKLKQGKISIEGKLDLHGMTVNEARDAVFYFLEAALKNHCRCVLIVHGKGRVGVAPILKNHVYYWLKQFPAVLAFYSAQSLHGGRGAVYVLLKNSDL